MSNRASNGGNLSAVLTGILLIYKIRPYFFWSGIFLNNYFDAIITIVIGGLFFLNRKIMNRTDKWLMALFGTIIVIYPFVGGQNFNVFVSIFPLLFIPFATDAFNKKVYENYLNIYCVIIGLSLIVWVFALIGALSPMRIIKPLNELKDYNYRVYPLLVMAENGSFRFSGLFDEPGVIGTISGLLLCCQRKLKSKQSFVLLLSGICSFSLFFYLVVAVYYTYHQLVEGGKVKNIAVYIVVAGVALLVVFSTPTLSELIVSRLTWDSDTGMFAGDNRASGYAWDLFDRIKGTHQFWFGIDDKWEFHEKVGFSSSFINVVIMYGVLFFSLIILFYLLYGYVYKVTSLGFLLFLFVLLATLYQRPGIFNPELLFLWIYLARKEAMQQSLLLQSKTIISKGV